VGAAVFDFRPILPKIRKKFLTLLIKCLCPGPIYMLWPSIVSRGPLLPGLPRGFIFNMVAHRTQIYGEKREVTESGDSGYIKLLDT
jgi:hypothetical protein